MHEFTLDELKKLVQKYFKNNKSYFQGTWIFSALFDKASISTEGEIKSQIFNHAPLKPEEYLYFLLLCSNREIDESIDNVGSIAEHWSARKLQQKDELTKQHIDNISKQAREAERYVKAQGKIIDAKEVHIINLEKELSSIKNSKTWKAIKKVKSKLR